MIDALMFTQYYGLKWYFLALYLSFKHIKSPDWRETANQRGNSQTLDLQMIANANKYIANLSSMAQ